MDRYLRKCLELVDTIQEMIPNKTLFEAWKFECTTPKLWSINWHALIEL